MATQQDVIKTFMKSLDESTQLTAKDAVDEAFNTASNTRFRNMPELTEAFLNDYNSYPKWEDFLREKCGIILDNEDSGSITGLDTSGTKIKTNESIVSENTLLTDLVELYKNADIPDTLTEEILLSPSKDPNLKIVPRAIVSSTFSVVEDLQFTKKGLTVTVPNYNWIIESAESGDVGANSKLIVINGLYSWWIENSLQLIEDSYGANFGFTNKSSAATKEIEVNLDETSNADLCGTKYSKGKLTLYVYMNKFGNITKNDTEGKASDGGQLDHTIAHEMTHAVMDVNITGIKDVKSVGDLGTLVSEGMAEITRGIDIVRSEEIVSTMSNPELVKTVLSDPYKTDYFMKGKDKDEDKTRAQYCLGYILMRYLAKQCAMEDSYATVLDKNDLYICATEGGQLFKANNGTAALQRGDRITTNSYGDIDTIKIGRTDNIISTPESKTMIVVKDHNNNDIATIFGSASVHDSGLVYKNFSDIDVSSELDNVSVTGGNGNDVILVKANNASINAKDGNDTVKITGDGANIDAGAGNDEVVIYGNNSPSISGGAGNNLIFIGGDKNTVDSTTYGNDTITVEGNDNYLQSAPNDVDKFIITNQSKNNTIIGFDDGYDEILFETGDIAAKVKIFNGSEGSVVIYSTKTGDTFVVLEYVTNGSANNILYRKENGDTIYTSIDKLLANTKPDEPGEEESETINVPTNGNVNNTRDDVIINAVSGNNVIQNSGSNVRISGGTDRDEVTNTGNNVNIDGKAGNDILSNGSDGDSSNSSQPTKGGDNVIIDGGEGIDLIYNYGGANVQLNGAEGTDRIYNYDGSNVTIDSGTDNDQINNSGEKVSINGGSGNDSLTNEGGSNVTINGCEGNDHVTNEGANSLIDGDDGDDYINNNNASSVTLIGGNGNDRIWNTGSKISITGDTGDDYISNNKGSLVTINSGDGNDTVNNTGSNVLIDSNTGKDSISNSGNNVSINSGAGNDYVYSSGDSVTIDSGLDDDAIHNRGNNVSIEAGDGNNFIDQYGDAVTITSGKDNDTINYIGKNISIDSGDGNDSIRNEASYNNRIIQDSGNNSTINSGGGNDTIYNLGSNVVINSGENDDRITNSYGSINVSINAGTGNDTIGSYNGNYATIDGGIGNDSINNSGSNSTINGGLGDDSIHNSGSSSTIDGGEDNDFINNQGDNSIIDGGNGKDTINNSDFNVLIKGGADDDSILNRGSSYTTIDGGDGNDYIETHYSTGVNKNDDTNLGRYISISGGDGNDSIENSSTYTTIDGGNGDDSISNAGHDASINGGNGNDFIENKDQYWSYYITTINGGKGNDTISLNGGDSECDLIQYNFGDGNDVIYNFDENDTLSITGSSYSSIKSNNDIILTVGYGKISLVGVANFSHLNINGTLGVDTTPADTTPADTTPADTTPADTTPADTTPADTTPADTTPADTTPADTTPADTTPSGQDQVVPVQIIRNLTGIDINHLEKVIVTDTDSLDDIIAERTVWLNFSTDSSKGVQNVDLSKSPYRQVVSFEGGNQKVQFSDENGNVAIVDASATGSKNIIFGNGDDLGIFYSSDANIRATVGSGRDSIITDNNARVRVDMTNSEGTKIIPYSGRIILDNYDPDSRAEIIIPDVTDITSAIKDNSIQLIGNEVRPNSSTRIQLNDSTNANIVNLSTEHGDTQKVGFTGINGGAVDAHELRGNFLLKGNYAENASDKQKRKPSTLISGNGHDTILAGARDFVDGGNGRNQIFLTPYDLRQIRDGATIAFSGNGRNTIHGFHEGFGYDGDVIQVKDFNNLKFKFDTDGLLLTANDSRIKFDGIGITSATTDDSTNSLGTNRAELIQITNGSSTMRTAVAQTNQSILVQEDDYITPNAFFGNRSGLNFSEYSGSVEINLTDGTGKLGKWDATFKGINKLQAGNGMSTLIGDDTRNTLIAGTGYTSMWGGAGNDKLIGKGNSTDKDGRTTFFFFAGDGRDVISDFTFLTPENRYDGIDDRINVGNSDINNAYRAGNNVVVVFDQNSYLILEDAVGKDFQIANMIAKVDRNIAYDGLANCYVASGGSSLTVDSTVRSAEIWLDNSHGTQFFGNIRTLDASAVEGNTSLVGNEFDDTIIAGQGDSSLWGGFSPSNDLLIGGSSRNTFFYCMGNGNDTIQGINDKDSIILSDVSLDQIIETSITADSVSIRFNDGGSLQIQGTSDVTYQLADGSRYSANHEHLEWDSR